MALVKIKLTKDILKLIENIHFTKVPSQRSESYPMTWVIDFFSLYGGSFLYEDISRILGRYDEHIDGTEIEALGPRFESSFEDYMLEIHSYLVNNIEYIEDLVHYYSNKGGLTEGVYQCKSNEKAWRKVS